MSFARGPTNYDNLLEVAYAKSSRRLTPVTLSDDILKIPKNDTLCVHLNGYIDRLTRDTIGSEIKLTEPSYITSSVAESDWATLFRQDIRAARSVFFLGYSLHDLDIKRILFESADLREKCFFIIGQNPKSATIRRASQFGNPVHLDTEQFGDLIAKKRATHILPKYSEIPTMCLQKFEFPFDGVTFSDQKVFDLLLLGEVSSQFVWEAINGGHRYYLERTSVAIAFDYVKRGQRYIIVHSELGNGKSLVIEGIKCRALENDYSIYTVICRSEDLLLELRQVMDRTTKILLIVEDYPDWFDVIEYFTLNANDQSVLILSARSSVHDGWIDHLTHILRVDGLPEIAVDQLNKTEIEWIIDFFDEYGLWGDQAAWNRERKTHFLIMDCKAKLQSILIKILESPQMISRFANILNQLTKKGDYYQVIVAIMILTVLNYWPSMDTLIELCGRGILDSQFRHNSVIRELIDFEGGAVRLRSALAAEFILKKAADSNAIITVLVRLARVADKNARFSSYYYNLLKQLSRFNNVQYLLPEAQKRSSIIRYYESIKNLEGCKRNPLFWLQFAIACLILEDYVRAGQYFKDAYSFAAAKGGTYDAFQIDNHFARYLLMSTIHKGEPNECMKAFRKAREILNQQIRKERMRFAYQVAERYSDFYDKFSPQLTAPEKDEVARAVKYVVTRIEDLPSERRMHKRVVRCEKVLRQLLNRIEADLTKEAQKG